MEQNKQKRCKVTFLMIYNTYLWVTEFCRCQFKNGSYLTLIIHATEALLWSKHEVFLKLASDIVE